MKPIAERTKGNGGFPKRGRTRDGAMVEVFYRSNDDVTVAIWGFEQSGPPKKQTRTAAELEDKVATGELRL